MAVPSLRHRAGKIEIDNRERQAKARVKEEGEAKPLAKEEHDARLEMLKNLGLLKK